MTQRMSLVAGCGRCSAVPSLQLEGFLWTRLTDLAKVGDKFFDGIREFKKSKFLQLLFFFIKLHNVNLLFLDWYQGALRRLKVMFFFDMGV